MAVGFLIFYFESVIFTSGYCQREDIDYCNYFGTVHISTAEARIKKDCICTSCYSSIGYRYEKCRLCWLFRKIKSLLC